MTEFEYKDRKYYFVYNGNVYFAEKELFGETTAIDVALHGTREQQCRLAVLLSGQGELVRRYQGYDNGGFLDYDDLYLFSTPLEAVALQAAVINAIARGINPDSEPEPNTIDLGLAKLDKKKE
jgi:hypothetical protein